MAVPAGIAQKDPNLAILDATGCATILAGDASGVPTFLEETGFIHHQNRLVVTQVLDHVLLQIITDVIGVPERAAQQVLDAIGVWLTERFG